ncbi:MAG: hypothetical protein SH821_04740, partial [Phototrophicales bacterium]|nr:hypothetical protein [Phototrophicales bacterium]
MLITHFITLWSVTDKIGMCLVTSYAYNGANQIYGYTYDNNGNLTSDGTLAYTWDRANRLLSHDGIS